MDIKNVSNPIILKHFREWENSKEQSNIYQAITKNKKIIKEKVKDMLLKQGKSLVIHSENLITILKEVLDRFKMSNTHWKLIVSIADREKNAMIDFGLFMNLIEASTKQATSHPKVTKI